MEKYQHPSPDTNVVDDLFNNSPNSYVFDQTDEPPTKENSLYLTITQYWFDEIVSGRKTFEYREIKPSTQNRYLDLPKKETDPIPINDLLPEDGYIGINEYNNGIFCFTPKIYHYMRLGVGYNKNRDTATIRLKGACTMPMRLSDGRIYRFNDVEIKGAESMTSDEYLNASYNENGELTIWIIGYELGEIVEVNKK